jgi:serine/threonine-protein kinase
MTDTGRSAPAATDFSSPSGDILERLKGALARHYVIDGEIGSGGMATVFAAQDVRHARRVAIKVLRPELSVILGGERFLNEIRVTAHLQHPHILQLLDSGDADGLLYYIMPLVEGESLRGRLERERQLPVADALRIAREVADALDYAHRHGVIHRDIKPENILLHDGRAMVADFGIALAVRNAGGARLTETGLSLGTPSYMSPEQATGEREVDARTDLYSLGCVLYEMLCGEPPHTAPTVQLLMKRVVTEKPQPVRDVRETVPEYIAVATETALAKLPADRFASAAEFSKAIQVDSTGYASLGVAQQRRLHRSRQLLVALACTAVGLALGVAGALLLRPRAIEPVPSRLSLLVPGGSRGAGLTLSRQIAITSDGSTVVYLAREASGQFMIMVHPLNAVESSPVFTFGVTGVGSVPNIFVPPGERRIVFAKDGMLSQIPIGGGEVTPLNISEARYAAWAPDGALWYNDPNTRAVRRSGTPQPVFQADSATPLLQQILPDGKTALAVRSVAGTMSGTLVALDLTTGARRVIYAPPVVEARYAAGHLIFASPDNSLNAVAFDAAGARITGTPVQIASDVQLGTVAMAQFAVADNGTVAYVPNQPAELVLLDRTGATRSAVDTRRNYHSPHFSPDGRRIAMDFATNDGRDVWVLDLEQRTQTRVTLERDGHDPVWAPDGKTLLYISRKSGLMGTYAIQPASPDSTRLVFSSPEHQWTGVLLANGDILTTHINPTTGSDIVRLKSGGRGPVENVLATQYQEAWPAVSHDGKWLAFASNQSGQQEVYVRALSGSHEIVQVSVSGGAEPVWSRDGGELFYRRTGNGEVDLVAAKVVTTPEFRVVSRTSLFPVGMLDAAQPHANYDVSPDGRTFVGVRRDGAMRIVVLQNVPAMVRRGAQTR